MAPTPARTHRWVAAAGCVLATQLGCVEESIATLVPIRCGLGPDAFDALRVETRGDFPPSDTVTLSLGAVLGTIDDLEPEVRAITVEGTFGDSIEAVGRTARLEREGPLPIYFSPPDALCGMESPVSPRQVGDLAVLPSGHVLAVGGRDAAGGLLDDIVHYLDVATTATLSREHLPIPSIGQTVHAWGDDTALVVGGAGSNPTAFASVIPIDVLATGELAVGDPVPIVIDGERVPGRAHHAGVRLRDGRVLVAGGCSLSANGACVPTPDSVLRTTLFMWPGEYGAPVFEAGPPLLRARHGHHLLVARDDVVFAVGGLDATGSVTEIEVLLPGAGTGWAFYGPSLFDRLLEGQAIVGAAVLEGGLLVLLLSDGAVLWVDEHAIGELEAWCDAPDAACPMGIAAGSPVDPWRRELVALPGERILLDSLIVPVAVLGHGGRETVDLAVRPSSHASMPPPARMGAQHELLADGSVVVMGGLSAEGEPAQPFVARVRPELDGPDERIPELGRLGDGAFIVHDEEHVSAVGTTLVLSPEPDRSEDLLATWAHIRGFRSRRFRFDVDLLSIMFARPRLVFPSGAIERIEIRFDRDAVRAVYRSASGESEFVVCSSRAIDFAGLGRLLRVDASPAAIAVRIDGELSAECPGLGARDVAVGLGAVGNGSIRASSLRLTRQ